MYYGEYLNSISHLVGAVLALVGLGALMAVAVQSGDGRLLAGFAVYGLTLVLLYTMSTLYHSFHPPRLKQVFKVLDHISIYLLIAGTYTPFMLVSVPGPKATMILAVVWGLAAAGTLSEVFLRGRIVKVIQLVTFLAMGWACALDLDSLRAALPRPGFLLLLLGGIAYTAGVIFYVLDKLKRLSHAHGIWHAFVLCGSVLHFIAVIGYVR
ncbi:putative membrane protein hemolysin III-like protein [Pseudohaliea rubra DSM 19751]|uniref:Putative membrane protein hemolysin III-like protein n=2 Tax=Pseudohaliea TaxID=1341120 RepID=A0A095X1A1_9GAMM|nr:putative membrane protein hemolysin III-like protein [Pseudohaliea rubra DSM 19751]